MYSRISLIITFYLILTVCSDVSGENVRQKRALRFIDKSSVGLTLLLKSNIVPTTGIMAFANGFRIVWDLPVLQNLEKHKINKRSIGDTIENVLDLENLHAKQHCCAFKYTCEYLTRDFYANGFVSEFFDYLFRNDKTNHFKHAVRHLCDKYVDKCATNCSMSKFTDIS